MEREGRAIVLVSARVHLSDGEILAVDSLHVGLTGVDIEHRRVVLTDQFIFGFTAAFWLAIWKKWVGDVVDVVARWVLVTSMGTSLGFAVNEICKEKNKDCFDQDLKLVKESLVKLKTWDQDEGGCVKHMD
ncbi:hypothetical protein FNV43_RR23950 [Rhamnella rubrinervis]|uniref:Uncharacterized protein n=1 Tax=Rhamnella rubrinervis TaxID=2594499 RepID=A0A8K0DPN5_9ROSA|nr:hypothetical protein FNV43_RR23950 [Rhamnella rubrinervis]